MSQCVLFKTLLILVSKYKQVADPEVKGALQTKGREEKGQVKMFQDSSPRFTTDIPEVLYLPPPPAVSTYPPL